MRRQRQATGLACPSSPRSAVAQSCVRWLEPVRTTAVYRAMALADVMSITAGTIWLVLNGPKRVIDVTRRLHGRYHCPPCRRRPPPPPPSRSRPLIIRSDPIPADRGLVWGESRPGPSLRYFEPAAGAVHRCSFSSVALDLGESSSGGALAPRANPATSGRWSMRSFGEYAFLGRFALRESSERWPRRENRRRCVRVSADLSRCFDLFIGLGRTAVLRGRSVTISELTMLDRHEESDGLRLGIHRPDDHRFHAGTKSSPRNRVGSRNRHGGWMGGKQRVGARAHHCFDIGLGFRRWRLGTRLSKTLRQEGGVLVGHAACRQQRRGAGKHAHRDLHRTHGSSLGRQVGRKACCRMPLFL